MLHWNGMLSNFGRPFPQQNNIFNKKYVLYHLNIYLVLTKEAFSSVHLSVSQVQSPIPIKSIAK